MVAAIDFRGVWRCVQKITSIPTDVIVVIKRFCFIPRTFVQLTRRRTPIPAQQMFNDAVVTMTKLFNVIKIGLQN